MNSFPQEAVLAACAQYGPSLNVVVPLDGAKVMTAIASNESSLGFDCGPRHEPAYDAGGSLSHGPEQRAALAKFGRDAACSYGPWQMMYVNFSMDVYAPTDLLTDLQACAVEFVKFMNNYVLGDRRAVTLADIGETWNLGHEAPDPEYVAKLQVAYNVAIGQH